MTDQPITGNCTVCGRPLHNPESIARGMGDTCAAKVAATDNDDDHTGLVPNHVWPRFGPRVDVQCASGWDGNGRTNVRQVYRHHTTEVGGMSWGYEGSGPADFALNILALAWPGLPVAARRHFEVQYPHTVKVWDGKQVSAAVWHLHQPFKRDLVARLDNPGGGTITWDAIVAWFEGQAAQ